MLGLLWVFFFVWLFVLSVGAVSADPKAPQEPEIVSETPMAWQAHPNKMMVINFPGELEGVEFWHVIREVPRPFPTCNTVRHQGNELFMVSDSPTPYLYIVEDKPIAWRFKNSAERFSLIKRTNDWITPAWKPQKLKNEKGE